MAFAVNRAKLLPRKINRWKFERKCYPLHYGGCYKKTFSTYLWPEKEEKQKGQLLRIIVDFWNVTTWVRVFGLKNKATWPKSLTFSAKINCHAYLSIRGFGSTSSRRFSRPAWHHWSSHAKTKGADAKKRAGERKTSCLWEEKCTHWQSAWIRVSISTPGTVREFWFYPLSYPSWAWFKMESW